MTPYERTEFIRAKKPVYAIVDDVILGKVKIELWSKVNQGVLYWRESFTCELMSCHFTSYPVKELWNAHGEVIWSNNNVKNSN